VTTTSPLTRALTAVLAALVLAVGFFLVTPSQPASAAPCNYGKQIYCDGGDEPVWQWDGVDDFECVGIPGVTWNADETANYSGVTGKVYYFKNGAYTLVHDSTAAAPAPAPSTPPAPKPSADPVPAPASGSGTKSTTGSTTSSGSTSGTKTATAPTPTATAAPTATPTATPTAEPTDDATATADDFDGVEAASTRDTGSGSGGAPAAIWLLGGLAVAAAGALGGYTWLRTRRARLATGTATADASAEPQGPTE